MVAWSYIKVTTVYKKILFDSLLADTKASAEGAVAASQAFQQMIDAVHEAEALSREADLAAYRAHEDSKKLGNDIQRSVVYSEKIKKTATDTAQKIQAGNTTGQFLYIPLVC